MTYERNDVVELLCDIKSSKGLKMYGKAGEIFLVINSAHWPVLLLQGKERFPCHIDNCKRTNKKLKS